MSDQAIMRAGIFEPDWTMKIGPLTRVGRGLLGKELNRQLPLVDELVVFCNNFTVKVWPVKAKVWVNSELNFVGHSAEKYSLMWFRQMEKQIAADATANCLFYGLGLWDAEKQPAWACKVFRNRNIELGL